MRLLEDEPEQESRRDVTPVGRRVKIIGVQIRSIAPIRDDGIALVRVNMGVSVIPARPTRGLFILAHRDVCMLYPLSLFSSPH